MLLVLVLGAIVVWTPRQGDLIPFQHNQDLQNSKEYIHSYRTENYHAPDPTIQDLISYHYGVSS